MAAAKVLIGVLATALLVLGLPQTIDSVIRLYADSSVDIDHLDVATSSAAAEAVTALHRADRLFGDGNAGLRAGIIERRLAFRSDEVSSQDTLLRAAVADLTSGLSRVPASALGWAELAMAQVTLGDSSAALKAWRNSIALANYDPQLNFWRAEIGVQLWLALTASDQQIARQQILWASRDDPRDVAALAEQHTLLAQIVRTTLARRSH